MATRHASLTLAFMSSSGRERTRKIGCFSANFSIPFLIMLQLNVMIPACTTWLSHVRPQCVRRSSPFQLLRRTTSAWLRLRNYSHDLRRRLTSPCRLPFSKAQNTSNMQGAYISLGEVQISDGQIGSLHEYREVAPRALRQILDLPPS